jgi:hypothetical protein
MTTLNAFMAGLITAVAVRSLFDVWRLFRNEKMPPPGEAWCVNCSLNGGKRKVISPDGLREHLMMHPPEARITIRAAWPSVKERKGAR